MMKLHALIYAIRYEATDVVSIELRPVAAEQPFPAYEPGAHIDLQLSNGMNRSYSLFKGDPEPNTYRIAVLKENSGKGGSRYVHEKLRVGEQITISAPKNNFKLHEDAEETVLLAGGIGITPILSMYERMKRLKRKCSLIYCARSRAGAAFLQEINFYNDDNVIFHFDDEQGRPPDIKTLLADKNREAHFYCCGPAPMLSAYEAACSELGFRNVHLERFSGLISVDDCENADGGQEFEIELKRSGAVYSVPADKSILRVLLDAGIEVDYSCEEGICGSCETQVAAGSIDHRDLILTEKERACNKSMMVCVSRCLSGRLVLDL